MCCPVRSGGKFLGTLSSITTWAGRTAALAALTASYSSAHNSNTNTNSNSRGNTGPGGSLSRQLSAGGGSGCCASAAVRGQLGSSRLLDVLEGWTKEAAADKQITVMIQLMQVGGYISVQGVCKGQRLCKAAYTCIYRREMQVVHVVMWCIGCEERLAHTGVRAWSR